MDHRPKCKNKTVKLLEYNIENQGDLGYDEFLATTSSAQSMKEKKCMLHYNLKLPVCDTFKRMKKTSHRLGGYTCSSPV